jgi:hypothetical protein
MTSPDQPERPPNWAQQLWIRSKKGLGRAWRSYAEAWKEQGSYYLPPDVESDQTADRSGEGAGPASLGENTSTPPPSRQSNDNPVGPFDDTHPDSPFRDSNAVTKPNTFTSSSKTNSVEAVPAAEPTRDDAAAARYQERLAKTQQEREKVALSRQSSQEPLIDRGRDD